MSDLIRPVILYRAVDFEPPELEAAEKHFFCTTLRPQIKKNDLVIGRFSLHPYYAEQAADIEYVGASLINSFRQHNYIADLSNYVCDLKELTPKTWTSLSELPEKTSFILKGATNSKKSNWNKLMFASDKKAASEVYYQLIQDGLIGHQRIYIREYVPLVSYGIGVGGIPISKEFRFFVAYGEVLCGAYYWTGFEDEFEKPPIEGVPQSFLDEAICRIGKNCNFYALDVAQKQDGNWIVIELNDGQFSGLSDNDPNLLYSRLKEVLAKQ